MHFADNAVDEFLGRAYMARGDAIYVLGTSKRLPIIARVLQLLNSIVVGEENLISAIRADVLLARLFSLFPVSSTQLEIQIDMTRAKIFS